MDITLFIAQIFGIYFTVVGLALIIRYKEFRKLIRDFADHLALIWLASIFMLTVGSILILTHSIWEGTIAIVVSTLSWLVFIKGIVYFILPAKALKAIIHAFDDKHIYMMAGFVSLIAGVYLLFNAF
jgi:uncharacterized protein YjeT (DUF2065 family)